MKLNEAGNNEDVNIQEDIDFEQLSNNNTFLNADITIAEIQQVVKKNEK